MRQLVFVYGSLRPGEVYHHLLAGAKHLGSHRTEPRYTMLDLGAYPAVIKGGRTAIVGDVLAVDAALLARLDVFEEHPHEYARTLIATPFGKAWMYLYRRPARSATHVVSGDWCNR